MVFTAEEALDEDGGAALFATVANMRDDCFCTPEEAHITNKKQTPSCEAGFGRKNCSLEISLRIIFSFESSSQRETWINKDSPDLFAEQGLIEVVHVTKAQSPMRFICTQSLPRGPMYFRTPPIVS
ncbi:hypothetical protein LIER_40129 [Lithospermum erythrorhizon]|uniref:Uncharacterized protein n=1 Tax=Lithospermum erythrorhizon TaxID=34254 RepID=A0AAV3QU54_LITER